MTNNMSAQGGSLPTGQAGALGKKIIKIQFVILLFGVVFAWTNFTIEFLDWINGRACSAGCSVSGPITNPFLTPCFYGALFFLVAFILSAVLLRESKKI